nr:phage antirepressor KilAC domain-containing protein [Clostridium beijerinckii]
MAHWCDTWPHIIIASVILKDNKIKLWKVGQNPLRDKYSIEMLIKEHPEYSYEEKKWTERAARLEAEKKVKVLEPKGEFYDDVAGSKDSIEMGHVAKVLGIRGIGRNNLFALLRDKKVLDRNNIPYQQYVDCGYFRVLEQKYTVPNGETKINIKTMVFQKGIDFIRKKIKEP